MVEDQLLAFPAGDEDDLVDSVSQAILFCAGSGPLAVTQITHGRGAPDERPPPAASSPEEAEALAAAPGGPLSQPIDEIEEAERRSRRLAASRRLTI